MLVLGALSTGCTKEYYSTIVENHYGATVKTKEYTIAPGEWRRNEGSNLPGSQNYLWCTKNNADITDSVMAFGTVQAFVYSVYDVTNNLGAWNTLPFVYPLEVWTTNDAGERVMVIVPENLRFEWEKGKVTFVIQDLDGFDPEDMDKPISFKVCVTK